jgi:Cu-Zn family superoxide dismutase
MTKYNSKSFKKSKKLLPKGVKINPSRKKRNSERISLTSSKPTYTFPSIRVPPPKHSFPEYILKDLRTSPFIYVSTHGVYDDNSSFIVPPNVYIFETQEIGYYCGSNIDEYIWDLVQGNKRKLFMDYLKAYPAEPREEYVDVFKTLNFYKPGDKIYNRKLSIGGGRMGETKFARREYAPMGFYRFDLGTSYESYKEVPKILPEIATKLLDETQRSSMKEVVDESLKNNFDLQEGGAIFLFSSCGEAQGLPKAKFDEIARHQNEQLLQFLQYTPISARGSYNVNRPSRLSRRSLSLANTTRKTTFRHPEYFHPSAFLKQQGGPHTMVSNPHQQQSLLSLIPEAEESPSALSKKGGGKSSVKADAVAVFNSPSVQGEVLFTQYKGYTSVQAFFSKLPPGQHGFHIHKAGDLRGEGCLGACDHYHKGPPTTHGGPPSSRGRVKRHSGDLGNIVSNKQYSFTLSNISVSDLLGRSVIVHADPDDCGKGGHEDSLTTGHSGARIGCAIIGRSNCSVNKGKRKTRRIRKH